MTDYRDIREPFDPSMIEVEIKNFTINTLVEMMKNNVIDLAPEFQRNGDIWPDEKKSRLIESLILGLPLPSFYFSYDSVSKKWIVIDGLQRLGALKAFMIDKKLALKGLDFLGEYYDKWRYDDFSFTDQLNMGMLTVTANVIKGNTPANVKYILFQRINSAGTPLNPQEIRNALNQGTASKFLTELAAYPLFKKMVRVDSKRMTDCEYALRFIAFSRGCYGEYRNKMDVFLNDQMAILNHADYATLDVIRKDFVECLALWDRVLGDLAFKNPTLPGKGVSKALFDMLMTVASKMLPHEKNALAENAEFFKTNYIRLFNDREFTDLLSSGTSKIAKINRRNDILKSAIYSAINGRLI